MGVVACDMHRVELKCQSVQPERCYYVRAVEGWLRQACMQCTGSIGQVAVVNGLTADALYPSTLPPPLGPFHLYPNNQPIRTACMLLCFAVLQCP
jgi:hypothetical protein